MYQRLPLPNHSLFAVFDGHGGSFAAQYAGAHFFRILSRQPAFIQYAHYIQSASETKETITLTFLQTALRDAFVDLDREILLVERGDLDIEYHESTAPSVYANFDSIDDTRNEAEVDDEPYPNKRKVLLHSSHRLVVKPDEDPGCTALVVILTPQFIVCANAGDSRAVYSRSGHRAVALSYDHKPDDEAEKRRIYRAGGSVHVGRVEGDLAVSRGLGDYRFKDTDVVEAGTDCFYPSDDSESSSASSLGESSQERMKNDKYNTPDKKKTKTPHDHMVTPIPDLMVYSREEEQDEFIVLACDGIWDVLTNQECVSTVAKIFQEGESNVGLLCEEVLDFCLEKGSKDNMTVIVIQFKAQKTGEGGGVEARRRRKLAATDPNNPNHHIGDY
jgi:serine/threonine protein phosphatase PrpC